MDLRGLAGTILVYKIASALSDQGADLDGVEKIAKYISSRLGTLGIGLDHCHVGIPSLCQTMLNSLKVPGTRTGESHLGHDEFELVRHRFKIELTSRGWVYITSLARQSHRSRKHPSLLRSCSRRSPTRQIPIVHSFPSRVTDQTRSSSWSIVSERSQSLRWVASPRKAS